MNYNEFKEVILQTLFEQGWTKLKNSVRDVRHIKNMNYKIKGYKSALQMIFLICTDDAFGRTSHEKHDSSNTCFH